MRDRHLLYLIGQPGSGKSTLADALTQGIESVEMERPFAHRLYPACELVELGAHRESFSGTDALPMNIQPKIVAWLQKGTPPFVLAEGDRLANGKFFQAVVDAGWNLRLAYLSLPATVASERRRAREVKLGSTPQDAKWVKGRQTKARRLAEDWGSLLYRLNADQPTVKIMADLIRTGDPVVSTLLAARPSR